MGRFVLLAALCACTAGCGSSSTPTAAAETGARPRGIDFTPGTLAFPGGEFERIDADGDGDVDLLQSGVSATGANRLLRNVGNRRYVPVQLPPLRHRTRLFAVGDIDNNGSQDFVAGNAADGVGGRNWLHWNDQFRGFSAQALPGDAGTVVDLRLADLDRDGDLDILIANDGGTRGPQANQVYRNEGNHSFVLAGTVGPILDPTAALAVADMNGDRIPDVILANDTPSTSVADRVLLGDGRGGFRELSNAFPLRSEATSGLSLGDLDGDGDADVVLAGPTVRILANDGSGRLTKVAELRFRTKAVALVDTDADGQLDLVLSELASRKGHAGESVDHRYFILLGNGRGGFVAPAKPLLTNTTIFGPGSIVVGDLDGDDDADLLLPSPKTPRTYWSQVRDLTETAGPRVGTPWPLVFRAKAGNAPKGQLMMPFLGVALLPQRVQLKQYGAWAINPNGSVLLGALAIPTGAGEAKLPIPIPADPAFRDVTLHLQAIVLHDWRDPSTWKVSNLWSGTIGS